MLHNNNIVIRISTLK